MLNQELEIYTDYLLCVADKATATGLSSMLKGSVSHDQITRRLSECDYTSKDLWQLVKSTVRQIGTTDGVLIFDDTVQEKKWTDENEINCWHHDHSQGRSVKGMNILHAVYANEAVSIPVGFEIIKKPLKYYDPNTDCFKRKSETTKNELVRSMIDVCVTTQLPFQYVLMDSWYSAVETFEHISKKRKHFIAALKENRLVALSLSDKKQGRFVRVDSLSLSDKQAVCVWLKGFEQEVLVVRQIFTNKDGSIGFHNLVCSDLTLTGEQVATIYKKRWKVEVFHKSLKSNAALAQSPTRTPRTQNNHVFMAIYAVFKLECLKMKQKLNHFTLRSKIFLTSIRQAYSELQRLRQNTRTTSRDTLFA